MEDSPSTIIMKQAEAARLASPVIATLPSEVKNAALRAMAAALEDNAESILAANAKDRASNPELSRAMMQRLTLSRRGVMRMAESLLAIAALPDPVGALERMVQRPNGLLVGRMRVPIGVIAVIFESRPNVTVDVAGTMLKSGNACILRGGKEALETNKATVHLMRQSLGVSGVPPDYLQFVEQTDHETVRTLCKDDKNIDLLIPRGGSALMQTVRQHARMPVLAHDRGVCHIYIEESADYEKAIQISVNAKVSNPSTCNAAETILVDEAIAPAVLARLVEELRAHGVEVRGCEKTTGIISGIQAAKDEDWDAEYLDLVVSIKIVRGFHEALMHIERHSTGVADAIITEDYARAWQFLRAIDSAAVYVNASTRLTDGAEFGLGAEVGISTAKTYDRGPMGAEELTVTKYVVFGHGQIRENQCRQPV